MTANFALNIRIINPWFLLFCFSHKTENLPVSVMSQFRFSLSLCHLVNATFVESRPDRSNIALKKSFEVANEHFIRGIPVSSTVAVHGSFDDGDQLCR